MSFARPGRCLSRLTACCPPPARLLGLAGRQWSVILFVVCLGSVSLGVVSLGVVSLGAGLLVASPDGQAPEGQAPVEQGTVEQGTVEQGTVEQRTEAQNSDELATEDRFVTQSLRGRIVWMAEALERRFGIQTVPEARQRLLALETGDGELHPIAEDVRGRAFRRDERLRNLADCELLARRFHGSPMIQVIRLYTHESGTRYELDYWCEICAITLFELKACDCCQGDIELRRREAP